MKKILINSLIVLVLLTGCASNGDVAEDISSLKDTINKQEQRIKELESENIELKSQMGIVEDSETVTTKDSVDKKGNIETIEVGDIITTDRMEITIKKIELSYDVLPNDTSSFYTHYPADPGNVYIHIDTDIKNLQKQNLACDDIMTIKADYNNGFTYDSITIPEDKSTGFTYANITSIKPLETFGVRFLIDCPQEVDETENPLVLLFNVDKQNFKYVIR